MKFTLLKPFMRHKESFFVNLKRNTRTIYQGDKKNALKNKRRRVRNEFFLIIHVCDIISLFNIRSVRIQY